MNRWEKYTFLWLWFFFWGGLQVEMWVDPKSGQSTGRIKHPDSLLRAVHTLVNRSQVDAIAVVGRFPDDEDDPEDYRQGKVSVHDGLCPILPASILRINAITNVEVKYLQNMFSRSGL